MNRQVMIEMAADIREMMAEVSWGAGMWLDRMDEHADGGFSPSGQSLDGGGHGSDVSNPTAKAGERIKRDPTVQTQREAERLLLKIHRDATTLFGMYRSNVTPREAPAKMGNPGCELCTDVVPGFYVPASVTVEVTVRDRKGRESTKRYRLDEWCYRYWLKYHRLPDRDQLVAHAEGRRVRVPA